jgi:hypothetical protein
MSILKIKRPKFRKLFFYKLKKKYKRFFFFPRKLRRFFLKKIKRLKYKLKFFLKKNENYTFFKKSHYNRYLYIFLKNIFFKKKKLFTPKKKLINSKIKFFTLIYYNFINFNSKCNTHNLHININYLTYDLLFMFSYKFFFLSKFKKFYINKKPLKNVFHKIEVFPRKIFKFKIYKLTSAKQISTLTFSPHYNGSVVFDFFKKIKFNFNMQ